jgi:hypothetical protein
MIQPGETMTTTLLIGKITQVFQIGSGLSIVSATAEQSTQPREIGSGLSIVSATAEQLTQPSEIGSGLMIQPGEILINPTKSSSKNNFSHPETRRRTRKTQIGTPRFCFD